MAAQTTPTNTSASAMTYNSLILDIQQYLERNDSAVTNQIPEFIMLAEFEIAQQIKTLGQLQVVESTMVTGNPVIPKPARWRKTVSMNLTTGGQIQPIFLRKYEYLRQYAPSSTTTGIPLYYADYNYDNWIVAPTPDTNYTFEVLYYERLAPLSNDNQTNWLTQNAPNAMLYGTLLQAILFVKNDQRQIFEQKYQEAMQSLKQEDQLRIADRQAMAIES
jgi:hypothetical protein